MTKRTRVFLGVAVGILAVGLGTGLVASYLRLQNLVIIGSDGPEELGYLPADAHVVGFVDVRHLMDSEFRRRLREGTEGGGAARSGFEASTGIDVERDVDRLVASFSAAAAGEGARPVPLVLARGRFDDVRIESALRDRGADVETHGDRRLLVHADGSFALAFLEPGLVGLGTAAAVRRAIETKTSGQGSVRENPDVMRLVEDAQEGGAWVVASGDSLTAGGRLPAGVAERLPPIAWLSASAQVNGDARGLIRAETRDEASGRDLRDVLQGLAALARLQDGGGAVAELLSSLEFGGDGRTVSISFVVPAALLDALASNMRSGRARPGNPDPAAP